MLYYKKTVIHYFCGGKNKKACCINRIWGRQPKIAPCSFPHYTKYQTIDVSDEMSVNL